MIEDPDRELFEKAKELSADNFIPANYLD